MPDMKLTAEVLLRIEGHTELHSVGTIDVPINITFGDKPLRPGIRGTVLKVDEDQLSRNIEGAVACGATRPEGVDTLFNTHIIEAIKAVANTGDNILIVHPNPNAILDQISGALDGQIQKTVRANGNERIALTNGTQIIAIRMDSHGRGVTARLLIVPIGLSHDQRDELLPVIATGGDILGYM